MLHSQTPDCHDRTPQCSSEAHEDAHARMKASGCRCRVDAVIGQCGEVGVGATIGLRNDAVDRGGAPDDPPVTGESKPKQSKNSSKR